LAASNRANLIMRHSALTPLRVKANQLNNIQNSEAKSKNPTRFYPAGSWGETQVY